MNEDETRLFAIFCDQVYRMSDSKMFDIKVWRGYIRELGMEFVDSCDDGSFCVPDPLRREEMRYISMSKETALKILFLGGLP